MRTRKISALQTWNTCLYVLAHLILSGYCIHLVIGQLSFFFILQMFCQEGLFILDWQMKIWADSSILLHCCFYYFGLPASEEIMEQTRSGWAESSNIFSWQVPYYLGYLTEKLPVEDRAELVKVAKVQLLVWLSSGLASDPWICWC